MEIIKQVDELTIERWEFSFIGLNLYLNTYSLEKKESKKHRTYKAIKKYDRLWRRDNTITEEEVPFTDEIKQEALNKFMLGIKVLKWSERM